MSGAEWVDDGFRVPDGPGELRVPGQLEPTGPARRADRIADDSEQVRVYGEESWILPGFGSSGPRCGEYQPRGVCSGCGEPDFAPHRCGRRECPDCWGIWAKGAAIRSTVRLQAFRETQPDDYRRQTGHFVYSPDEVPQSFRSTKGIVEDAYRVASEKGMRGGMAALHLWRLDEETKREYREQADEATEIGAWVWVREEYPEEWREHVEWEPHVHVIGVMTRNMEPGRESENFIWEHIRSFSRYEDVKDRESHNDVYGAIRYLLSHAAVHTEEEIHSYVWFGELSNCKFTEEEKPAKGVMRRLERIVTEVAGGHLTEEAAIEAAEELDDDTIGECAVEGCGGVVIDVFVIPDYLVQAEPPPEVSKRMVAAYEWRMGERKLPSGAVPQSEQEAREAFEMIL